MSKDKLLKQYVSPIDKFIKQFDAAHPGLSKSQKKEIAKHEQVFRLRDVPEQPNENKLPEGF